MKRGTDLLVKFLKLQQILKLTKWQTKGLLQAIWDFTSENALRGNIGRFSDEDIAIGIDYREDPKKLICALVATGWLDQSNEHRLIVHDWHDHAEEWVQKRVTRAATKEPGYDFYSKGVRQRQTTADNGILKGGHPEPYPGPLPYPKRAPDEPAFLEEKENQNRSETLGRSSDAALTGQNAPTKPDKPDTPARARKSREPDELFDTIALLTASDKKATGSHIGRVCKALRSADPPYTPAEVRKLVDVIRVELPWVTGRLTLGMIEKHIGLVRAPPPTDSEDSNRRERSAKQLADIKAAKEAAQKNPAKPLNERR